MKRRGWSSHVVALVLVAGLALPVATPATARAEITESSEIVDGKWGDFLRGVGCGIAVVGSLSIGPLGVAGAVVGCLILIVGAAEG